MTGADGGDLATLLARGTAKLEKVVGNGARQVLQGLSNVGRSAGKAAKSAKLAATATKISGSAATLSLALVTQGINTAYTIAILDLIKTNTEIRDREFNRWNADYTNLINLLSQANNDIDEANRVNAENQVKFNEQLVINDQQRQQLLEAQANINDLAEDNRNKADQISILNQTLAEFRAEVEANQAEADDVIDDLVAQGNSIEEQLATAQANIVQIEDVITRLLNQVAAQQTKIDDMEANILRLSDLADFYRAEFIALREDVEQGRELTEAQISSLGARLTLAERKLRTAQSSVGSGIAVREAANTQNKILDLASVLAGLGSYAPTITATNIYNNTSGFESEYADLISQVNAGGAVNQEQLDDFRDNLLDGFANIPIPGLGLTVAAGLSTTINQTTRSAISSAVESGVCSSTQPGGCMQNNVFQPLNQRFDGLVNSAGTAFSAANFTILNAMQPVLNTVKTTTDTIKGVVNATNAVVNNATHGLAAIQNFASKAWEATGADKILNAITTAVVIHNGVQLSTNLTATIGETASVVLDAMGIQDETGNPIDVNGFIRAKLNNLLTTLLGAETYAALTQKLATYNRIYQASANVLDAANDLFDSARSVAESTAENTGKIGNALLEAGVVYEDAYDEMAERISPQSRAQRRLERFRQGLEEIEDTVSTVGNIASEVVSTKDSFTELKEAKEEWQEEKQAVIDEIKTQKAETKTASQAETDVTDTDFDRTESGT